MLSELNSLLVLIAISVSTVWPTNEGISYDYVSMNSMGLYDYGEYE